MIFGFKNPSPEASQGCIIAEMPSTNRIYRNWKNNLQQWTQFWLEPKPTSLNLYATNQTIWQTMTCLWETDNCNKWSKWNTELGRKIRGGNGDGLRANNPLRGHKADLKIRSHAQQRGKIPALNRHEADWKLKKPHRPNKGGMKQSNRGPLQDTQEMIYS